MNKEIAFDRSLYLPEAVQAAATAFAEHAQNEVKSAGDATIAILAGVSGDDLEHSDMPSAIMCCTRALRGHGRRPGRLSRWTSTA